MAVIIELNVQNFMRLKAARITPRGSVVKITGANGQGKTSVLRAIEALILGSKFIPDDPIHGDAQRAVIQAKLGGKAVELIVTREITRSKPGGKDPYTTKLRVEGKTGTPQAALTALMSQVGFDPLEFLRAAPKRQIDMIKALVPGTDFDQIDTDNAADAESMRLLRREIKDLEAKAGPDIPAYATLPTAPVDVAALLEEMTQVAALNGGIEQERNRRTRLQMDIESKRSAVERLTDRIGELQKQIDDLICQRASISDDIELGLSEIGALPPLGEPVDVQAVRKELESATATNALIAENAARQQLLRDVAAKRFELESLADAIAGRNEDKQNAIAAARLPLPGLSIGEDAILLNGHPLSQASTAEGVRLSAGIAMALNPDLRVFFIHDGSLLDEHSMAEIEVMAEQNEYQIWTEVVDTSGAVGFVVEDGEVREAEAV